MRKSDVSKAKQNLFSNLTSGSPQTSPIVDGTAIKRYVIINNSENSSSQSSATDAESSQESNVSEAISLSPSEATPVQTQGDQILLKAHLSHPNLPDKQPTLLKLSRTQLQSVLKSMPNSPGSSVSSSDYKVTSSSSGLATTQVQNQNGSQMQVLHATKQVNSGSEVQDFLVSPPDVTGIRKRKRVVEEESSAEECYFDAKRPKKDVEASSTETRRSPPVDSEVAAINSSHLLNKVANGSKPRPSPLRALHLEPEFQSSKQSPASTAVQANSTQPSPTVSQSSIPLTMAAPTQVPPGMVKHRPGLVRSKSASPSAFMFGGRGVGSLQSETSNVQAQPSTYISASPGGIISPLNGCAITPVNSIAPGITAQVISTDGYQITPTSSIRPSRNIVPSSGAILNLVPHLQANSAQEGESTSQRVTSIPVSTLTNGGTRILTRKLSADQITALRARQNQPQPQVLSVPITSNIQAQTQFFRIDTQGILQTPTQQQQQQFVSQIISPSLNNTTPSTQLATPRSFFQSTPSGSLIRITTHQVSPTDIAQQQGSAVSAFRVVNGQTFTPITETVTARRLTLSAEQTP